MNENKNGEQNINKILRIKNVKCIKLYQINFSIRVMILLIIKCKFKKK